MGPYPLTLLIGHQMGILMNQGNQEPIPIGVVIDGYLHPSVFVTPEIAVLGRPTPGYFQMTGMLLQKHKDLFQGGFRNVFRQNVSFAFHGWIRVLSWIPAVPSHCTAPAR